MAQSALKLLFILYGFSKLKRLILENLVETHIQKSKSELIIQNMQETIFVIGDNKHIETVNDRFLSLF